MKNGEKLICPRCGERTLAREKKIFDGNFAPAGVKFVCALCGAELKDDGGEKKSSGSGAALERLSALLGGETAVKVRLAPETDDGHICLHCGNFIRNPFVNRCALSMREVESTDSCEKFEAAK